MSKRNTGHSLAIWPTLPLNVHFRRPSAWRPFPLNEENCRIFSLARQAIFTTCQALKSETSNVVLVPAYHHGSEVEALIQAGLYIRYYEVNEHLQPNADELESLLSADVCALYLIHYLGFPQDALFWRKWCDERHLLLMEDAAQAFLATQQGVPLGSIGHMGFFCLYKTYGLPDGGVVIAAQPPAPPTKAASKGFWKVFKRHVNFVASRRGEIGLIHKLLKPYITAWNKRQFDKKGDTSLEFALGDANTPPTVMTTRLLPKILDEKTAERRRANYRFLLRHLSSLVPPAFAGLPQGACPFAFPIEVPDAKEFLGRLRQQGVMGLLFWLNPHPSLPVDSFPRSRALRERVLALPVHQELTLANLHQIVDAVHQTINATSLQPTFFEHVQPSAKVS